MAAAVWQSLVSEAAAEICRSRLLTVEQMDQELMQPLRSLLKHHTMKERTDQVYQRLGLFQCPTAEKPKLFPAVLEGNFDRRTRGRPPSSFGQYIKPRKPAIRPEPEQEGIACIWVVLTILVIIGVVGLSIDMGHLAVVGQQLQIGADAAALAGAQHVRTDIVAARAAAVNLGLANWAAGSPIELMSNDVNAADGDIVVGRFDSDTGTFDPDATALNAVKVVARRTDTSLGGPVSLLFGPAFGVDTANMARSAIAMIGGGTGSGLIVLADGEECALEVWGSVEVDVDNGAVQVNSTDDCASCFQGTMSILADEINSVGGICTTGVPTLPPELNTPVDPVPDPLAFLPEPTWDAANDLGTVAVTGGENVTCLPGYYSGGISINNGTMTLEPGIYILDGVGLEVTGSADFFAEGVMIFITGTGHLDLAGGGVVRMTPPDPELYSYPDVDTYEGVTIFQARDNTNPSRIIGTTLMDLQGTYYFPSNHVAAGGNATKLGNQLVVYTLDLFGNGRLTINYDGSFPAPGSRVFLVR